MTRQAFIITAAIACGLAWVVHHPVEVASFNASVQGFNASVQAANTTLQGDDDKRREADYMAQIVRYDACVKRYFGSEPSCVEFKPVMH